MKSRILVICAVLLVSSCQQEEKLPEDLEGLQKLHIETKTSLSEMQSKLIKIETKMTNLDSTLFQKPKKLVTTLPVSKGDFQRFIELQGAVAADETVYVTSEIGGRIIMMKVKEGDYVAAGQLVARIDLVALDKQLAELNKTLELAEQIYERQERLWQQNIGTEIQYLQAKNNVERIEKSKETLAHQKTKSNIYAPISGEIARLNKELGEVAAPGEPLAAILNNKKLKIVIDLPENLLPVVNRGDEVTVRIPAINYEKKHRVKRIGSQVNPANRTIPVEVTVYNTSKLVKPNLLATMLIKDFEASDVITIPSTLLQQEVSGNYFVFTVGRNDAQLIAHKTQVMVGESYEDQIVILEGLNEGDQLIAKGSRQVAQGEHIILDEDVKESMVDEENESK